MDNSSGCSSGCESGWTSYLNSSSFSPYQSKKPNASLDYEERKKNKRDSDHHDEEEEVEDLSMVSDASSGPQHYIDADDEEYVNLYSSHATFDSASLKKNGKIKKTKEDHSRKVSQQQHSILDDTASSPVFNISNNNFTDPKNFDSAENLLEISQGYSATHFQQIFMQRKPEYYNYKGHHDICYASVSGNMLQQNQLYQERR